MSVRNCEELGKNLQNIVKRLLQNQDLCKLLYYAGKDPLNEPDIVDTNILLNKNIKVVPKNNPIETDCSVVNIMVMEGIKTGNKDFRAIRFKFFVYVPMTNWIIKNESLRPFLILGELEKSLDGKNINGLGQMQAGTFEVSLITETMTCYSIEFFITEFN